MHGFALNVALPLADASEEKRNANGGNDTWSIALNVAPKTRKMQQHVLNAEQVWHLAQPGDPNASEQKKNVLDYPTAEQSQESSLAQ
jgi:hypothetical protein